MPLGFCLLEFFPNLCRKGGHLLAIIDSKIDQHVLKFISFLKEM